MNVSSPYSATIERMGRARNVPTFENRSTWSPTPLRGLPSPPAKLKLHPRVCRLQGGIKRLLGIDEPSEMNAILEHIQTLLVRCGYHLQLLRRERQWKTREAKRAYRHPRLREPRRRRGRPTDGVNLAYHQLGLGLAAIWAAYSGRRLTRRFDTVSERDCGPFWQFVELVLGVFPARLRIRRKGHLPRIDAFVRASIGESKVASEAAQEYRRRGLIDENRWS